MASWGRPLGRALLCGAAVLLVLACAARAQITFSRDWNAGKRAGPAPGPAPAPPLGDQCGPVAKSASALCQMLLSEIRQMASCELRSLLHYSSDENSNPSDLFMDLHGRR
ncbi:hypothetical protein R5R35_007341 [Gryllus longicercus]|uniref:Uncharacterized protein n=1 Tax=Gryllus longicercus TaxID=2509291 RepID=A0AAN9UZV5_9ORTH